ncbi:MAG: dTDP-4-dehydrorhamnose 3,5-epimerase [Bacteroidales bacterium]|jgi:dTDP-4-dehydrorhamnose 3,5-epimerase|nr:dTDP-4-dehydrorhamnose 3,5-epimerase [Bacteroidales bacterium]
MNIETAPIEGLLIITSDVFKDDRGVFMETFNSQILKDYGIPELMLQDNQSISKKRVLRGLHFQAPPHAQGKLVRVISGSVLDVAVDLRKKSPTYGKWYSVLLSGENNRMFWIPEGFAHGFLALENDAIFAYKCTKLYNQESERSLNWADPDLAINWGVADPVLSEKDKIAPFFKDFISPF